MNYHSRQESSEAQIFALSTVLCILDHANCFAQALQPCFPRDQPHVLLRVHASCLVDCGPACLQGDWQYPCHFLKAYLSTRFRQKAVNQWAESLFQTPGSKLYPKSFYSCPATPDCCFQSQHLSCARVSPAVCSKQRTVQNVISNCNALRS